jgi:D-amino-acid oxidase
VPAHILVLGAGVSGLSAAHEFAASGRRVTIWAREEPLATTSSVAAALWYPFEAGPPDRVATWAGRSYRRFVALARRATPGVVVEDLLDLRSPALEVPRWVLELEAYAPLAAEERVGFAQGWRARVPVIETPLYLPWLAAQVQALGCALERRTLASFADLRGFDAVVNCTGLGARELCGDPECFPIRGQIARVPRGSVARALVFQHADGRFGYVIPRAHDCVLGGTAEHGSDSLAIDPATTEAIVARCRALEPRLAAKTTSAAAGLRPGRRAIRLEREPLPSGVPLVHDYGHGGCGVTLSWACAEDARALVDEALA